MPEAIENYVAQSAAVQFRRRAFFIWSFFVFLAASWIFLIGLAPIAESNGFSNVSNPLYKFFSFLCHQNPERSFAFDGQAFAVCSRCFGIYSGLLLGSIVYPFLRPVEETEAFPRVWLFAALIPMAIDWLLGVFGIWDNTHLSRFLTGAILGAACAVYIVPALIELFGLLSKRRKEKRLPD